jgi:hypothetical protein
VGPTEGADALVKVQGSLSINNIIWNSAHGGGGGGVRNETGGNEGKNLSVSFLCIYFVKTVCK